MFAKKQQRGPWFLFLLLVDVVVIVAIVVVVVVVVVVSVAAVVSVAVTSEVAGYLRPARGLSHRFPEASIHLSKTRVVQIMSLKRS